MQHTEDSDSSDVSTTYGEDEGPGPEGHDDGNYLNNHVSVIGVNGDNFMWTTGLDDEDDDDDDDDDYTETDSLCSDPPADILVKAHRAQLIKFFQGAAVSETETSLLFKMIDATGNLTSCFEACLEYVRHVREIERVSAISRTSPDCLDLLHQHIITEMDTALEGVLSMLSQDLCYATPLISGTRCGICLDMIRVSAATLQCGHLFCHMCLSKPSLTVSQPWLASTTRPLRIVQCPLCKVEGLVIRLYT